MVFKLEYELSDLVRSLVRIPTTGYQRKLRSYRCLDLGKVSSSAASVPIPTYSFSFENGKIVPNELVKETLLHPQNKTAKRKKNSNDQKKMDEEPKIKKLKYSSSSSKDELISIIEQKTNENKELQRKLSLFQQLFRDKSRLTSVVKRLGLNVVNPLAGTDSPPTK